MKRLLFFASSYVDQSPLVFLFSVVKYGNENSFIRVSPGGIKSYICKPIKGENLRNIILESKLNMARPIIFKYMNLQLWLKVDRQRGERFNGEKLFPILQILQ